MHDGNYGMFRCKKAARQGGRPIGRDGHPGGASPKALRRLTIARLAMGRPGNTISRCGFRPTRDRLSSTQPTTELTPGREPRFSAIWGSSGNLRGREIMRNALRLVGAALLAMASLPPEPAASQSPTISLLPGGRTVQSGPPELLKLCHGQD